MIVTKQRAIYLPLRYANHHRMAGRLEYLCIEPMTSQSVCHQSRAVVNTFAPRRDARLCTQPLQLLHRGIKLARDILVNSQGCRSHKQTSFLSTGTAPGANETRPLWIRCSKETGERTQVRVGLPFAIVEGLLLLAAIAQHVSFSLVPGQFIEPDPHIPSGVAVH